MAVIYDYLCQLDNFSTIPPPIIREIANYAHVINVHKREVILHQDEPSPGLFIIMSGHVKLYRIAENGTQILALLMPGDCFGAESIVQHTSSSFTAASIQDGELVIIPADAIQTLLQDHAELRMTFLRIITGRLQQFVQLVHTLSFLNVTSRVAMMLCTLADMEGVDTPTGIEIPRTLTQQEFGDVVGAAREVVSRTLRKLEQDGIIQVSRKSILICDEQKIRELSTQENT